MSLRYVRFGCRTDASKDKNLDRKGSALVLKSDDRILTTHTGSLPRPEPLTELYIQRAYGKPVDAARMLYPIQARTPIPNPHPSPMRATRARSAVPSPDPREKRMLHRTKFIA